MSNNDSNSNEDRKYKPSFSGGVQPSVVGISLHSLDDDLEDEPSRRVAGLSFASGAGAVRSMLPAPVPCSQATVPASSSKASSAASPALVPASASSSSSGGGSWELRDAPTLPAFHPLERTAVFVPHQTNCREVASRVSRVLRERSVASEYDDEKAKVRCRTVDGVDFRVRLYRGRGAHSHGIIVEVQRRFGASVAFHRDTQAILAAAEGSPTSGAAPPPPPSLLGSSDLPLVSDDSESEADSDYRPNPASSLRMVESMMSHPGRDSQYLAYQTLLPLVSAARVGASTAAAVASELLRPGQPVGSRVVEVASADGDDMDTDDSDDPFQLRSWALAVLAAALEATDGSPLDRDPSLSHRLRPALLRDLAGADRNLRHAQLSAAVAEHVLVRSNAGSEAEAFRGPLEHALRVGEARHEGLRLQASRALDALARRNP